MYWILESGVLEEGKGGIYKREAAPCYKGMGPKLNFDIKTTKIDSCSNTSNELLLTSRVREP
jgi:hypothetical protein